MVNSMIGGGGGGHGCRMKERFASNRFDTSISLCHFKS